MGGNQFVFSNWIFLWYVFYVLGLTKFNPKIGLLLGIVHNICMALIILYFKKNWLFFIGFCILIFFYKWIPLWSLRHAAYRWKDVYFLLGLFAIFVVWVSVNGQLKIMDIKYELLKANLHRNLH